ncbi:MAG TPA: lytic transglycosylase domain-containing protein [Burkholderiaceae bacterium]|nr:lytic transglycosylase domain-containing protein [Burkholderiaceae bacterium]
MDTMRRRLVYGLGLMLCAPASFAEPRRARSLAVPEGYRLVAHERRVPSAVLYGVALQESALVFGEAGNRCSLPWPWTLNVAGRPARFAMRAQAEERLDASLRSGIDSVDVGPMGINWRYHKTRLVSVQRSLDPYWNLRVGASLLGEHFAACNDWREAVGRYHAPANKQRAEAYSASVFARLRRLGHA